MTSSEGLFKPKKTPYRRAIIAFGCRSMLRFLLDPGQIQESEMQFMHQEGNRPLPHSLGLIIMSIRLPDPIADPSLKKGLCVIQIYQK